MQIILPIVGAHYRPPAKALLQHLPAGAALSLLAEPSNEYDPNAIAVFVEGAEIPESQHDELAPALTASGHELAEVLDRSWQLGYIPAIVAKEIHNQFIATLGDFDSLDGALGFDASGKPTVRFELAARALPA